MEFSGIGIEKSIYFRTCDTCRVSAALLFCRADTLFLCLACDAKVHAHRSHARHERVWTCEVCKHAPAIVTCKADAALLCQGCDRDIHSANPLASGHERVPVVPCYDTAKLAALGNGFIDDVAYCPHTCFPGDETAISTPSWLFQKTTPKLEADTMEMKSVDLLYSDADQFLEFDCNATDSVVPVQTIKTYEEATTQQVMNQLSNKYPGIDFTKPKFNSYNPNHNFGAQSISQNISSSSIDVGVVPDGSSMSDISYPYVKTSASTTSIVVVPSQVSDREARVMRYREKRKNRKFEKTIRYASRKAYAEARPRIKGRFAKRSVIDSDKVNNMFISNSSVLYPVSSVTMTEITGYSIVPSL